MECVARRWNGSIQSMCARRSGVAAACMTGWMPLFINLSCSKLNWVMPRRDAYGAIFAREFKHTKHSLNLADGRAAWPRHWSSCASTPLWWPTQATLRVCRIIFILWIALEFAINHSLAHIAEINFIFRHCKVPSDGCDHEPVACLRRFATAAVPVARGRVHRLRKEPIQVPDHWILY